MNARTELSAYTADMLCFHPTRVSDRVGWEGLLNSSWFEAYERSGLCYRRSLSWKMHYKTQLLRGIVYYYLFQFKLFLNQFLEVVAYLYQCHFKSLLNRIINGQAYWTCYDNPLSEFFLLFYFSSSKPHERYRQ